MWERFKEGMTRTRQRFTEQMNMLLDRGPDVDDEFWDGLEEALIMSDVGAITSANIVYRMKNEAKRHALPDAYAVMDALSDRIAEHFTVAETNIFDENPVLVLFVGINGAGKTTTVGKIAYEAKAAGRNVLLGSADTFRAAAIEQLEEWGRRADVEIVERERGSDPASVCYDTIERGEEIGADMILIDTAGRLHTSDDLMRELQKVVNVVRKRSQIPVKTVLVIDATTGQNGLSQARQFHKALDLDAVIVTKLDGTARGGIALAVSSELELPIAKIGVGERLEDLQDFDPRNFSAALIGAEPEEVPVASEQEGGEPDEPAFQPEGQASEAAAEPEPEAESAVAGEPEPETQLEPEAECASALEDGTDGAEGAPGTGAEPGPVEGQAFQAEADGQAEGESCEEQVSQDDAQEPAGDDVEQAEEEKPEKEGVFKRLFRWAGRK
ncbi:MAG: signal recognition particle-docking protein FtsY [Eggerthellaceae bacterium]